MLINDEVNVLIYTLGFVANTLVFPLIFGIFAVALIRPAKDISKKLFYISIGSSPVFTAYVLMQVIRFFPNRQDYFYMAAIYSVYLLLLLFSLVKRKNLQGLFTNESVPKMSAFEKFITAVSFGAIAASLILIFSFSVFFPTIGNDPLGYAVMSDVFYKYKDLTVYPMIDRNITGGYYAASTHPLGYYMLLVWQLIVAKGSMWMLKTTSFTVCFLQAVMFIGFFGRKDLAKGAFAALLLCATPLYLYVGRINHIDPLRLLSFTCVVLWLIVMTENNAKRYLIPFVFFLAMNLFVHSLGVLTVFILFIPFMIYYSGGYVYKFITYSLIVLFATAIGGMRYLQNLIEFHKPFVNKVFIFADLPKLAGHHADFLEIYRGLDTFKDRVMNGLLSPFTSYTAFDISYWVFVLLAVMYLLVRNRSKAVNILILIVAGFYAIVFASYLAGSLTLIKNNRYILTVQPAVVLCIVYILFQRMSGKLRPVLLRGLLLIIMISSLTVLYRDAKDSLRIAAVNNINFSSLLKPERVKIKNANRGAWNILTYINENTPKDSVFLVFRQSEFAYYAKRKFYRYLDLAMIPAYKAKTVADAYDILIKMGIRYIYLPNYAIAAVQYSKISGIIGNAKYAKLIMKDGGYKLYQLNRKPNSENYFNVCSGESEPSGVWTYYSDPSKTRHETYTWSKVKDKVFKNPSDAKYYAYLFSGAGRLKKTPVNARPYMFRGNMNYQLKIDMEGTGKIIVYAYQFGAKGEQHYSRLEELVLNNNRYEGTYQLKTIKDIKDIRIVVYIYPGSEVKFRDYAIRCYDQADISRSGTKLFSLFDPDKGLPGFAEALGRYPKHKALIVTDDALHIALESFVSVVSSDDFVKTCINDKPKDIFELLRKDGIERIVFDKRLMDDPDVYRYFLSLDSPGYVEYTKEFNDFVYIKLRKKADDFIKELKSEKAVFNDTRGTNVVDEISAVATVNSGSGRGLLFMTGGVKADSGAAAVKSAFQVSEGSKNYCLFRVKGSGKIGLFAIEYKKNRDKPVYRQLGDYTLSATPQIISSSFVAGDSTVGVRYAVYMTGAGKADFDSFRFFSEDEQRKKIAQNEEYYIKKFAGFTDFQNELDKIKGGKFLLLNKDALLLARGRYYHVYDIPEFEKAVTPAQAFDVLKKYKIEYLIASEGDYSRGVDKRAIHLLGFPGVGRDIFSRGKLNIIKVNDVYKECSKPLTYKNEDILTFNSGWYLYPKKVSKGVVSYDADSRALKIMNNNSESIYYYTGSGSIFKPAKAADSMLSIPENRLIGIRMSASGHGTASLFIREFKNNTKTTKLIWKGHLSNVPKLTNFWAKLDEGIDSYRLLFKIDEKTLLELKDTSINTCPDISGQ